MAGRMPSRFEALAAYHAECARGIMHTPEFDAAMVALQREYGEWQNGLQDSTSTSRIVITCTRHGVGNCWCLAAPTMASATRPPGGYPAGTVHRADLNMLTMGNGTHTAATVR
jgi:hypothetical protein